MNNIFKIEQLTAGYENTKILNGINMSIEAGKVTTIIGPNGCGKSTLLKTIGRILKKQQGNIYIQGENMKSMPTKEIAKRLAMLSQAPSAPGELKVEELISYGRYPHRKNVNRLTTKDKEMIEWAMTVTNTLEFRSRNLSQLSGGQRQRVWLAMALAQETDILLLDEPTTYLDMSHQLEVLNIVKRLNEEHGCTIIMVLHDINHAARFSHHLVTMKKGEIMKCGTPFEIISCEVLRVVFQIDACIIQDPKLQIPICYSYDVLE
ncbi:ABC transporter ATP-binding protein [Psychrobacillus sp. FSL K6-4615]|uniref:ABC transporter ATP-binding protein n=1 Tax=Psychrobacillus sp. FSL K6-4615 TaxID=2921551 RepID=UPI0030F6CA2C